MTNEELFESGRYEELYHQNTGFIYSLIKKFPNIPAEEVIANGNYGFSKALKSYTTDKGTLFLTYASRCIINEILMQFRKDKRNKGTMSLNEPLSLDGEGHSLALEDTLEDKHDYYEDALFNQELQCMKDSIALLPLKYQDVAWLFIEEIKQPDIAKTLKISQSYVSRILTRLPNKLKKIMKEGKYMNKKAEVFKMLDEGKDMNSIAGALKLTFRTVQTYKTDWFKSKGIIHKAPKRTEVAPEKAKDVEEHTKRCYTKREAPTKPIHLKTTSFRGDVMNYNIMANSVVQIVRVSAGEHLQLEKKDIQTFIEELTELMEVI